MSSGRTVSMPVFNGKEDAWAWWSMQFMAFLRLKGCDSAVKGRDPNLPSREDEDISGAGGVKKRNALEKNETAVAYLILAIDVGRWHRRMSRLAWWHVEFCKLFRNAQKRALPEGRALIREGVHPNVYFLVQGSIDVRKNGRTIAKLEGDDEGHCFLGEMTLLDRLRSTTYEDAFASADAIVSSKEAVVYEWKYDDMLELLRREHEMTNALLAYISFDLQDKLHLANSNQLRTFLTKKTKTMEKQEAMIAELSSRIEANEAEIRNNAVKIGLNDAKTKRNDARINKDKDNLRLAASSTRSR